MRQIRSGEVSGEIAAPSSKSMMQRAVAAATLAHGKTTILAPSFSEDGKAALRIARALGATILERRDRIEISGDGVPTGEHLLCGEAGFSIRMFSAISALYSVPLVLEGAGSLTTRPMTMIEGPLRSLGAQVSTTGGRAPITICGPIHGGTVTVDGKESSQFLSGLLMALPRCATDTLVTVPELKSKPYVLMTLELLRDFGISVTHNQNLSEFIVSGNQQYKPITYTVEGDWSGASFLLVAGAIAGNVTVKNLKSSSAQADRAIIEALRRAGAAVVEEKESVTVGRSALSAFEFDATECPDLFPPLVALAAQCRGMTVLHGARRLTHKESDRGAALKREFGTLGIEISVEGDIMTVTGGTVKGGSVFSHHDHRIAMACGLAGLVATHPVDIEHPECVAKSYPDFFEVIDSLRVER